MAGSNGPGRVFRDETKRPSYIDIGQQFLRTVNELKGKLSRKDELGKDLKVLNARDDTNKRDLYALKSQIRANKIDIKKLQRDRRNTWKQLKIEVGYEVEKNHNYGFFDAPPGAKKLIKASGFLELGLIATVGAMAAFPEQVNHIVGFPTSAQIYATAIIGSALNGVFYAITKVSEHFADSREDSVKSKVERILDQYR